MELKYFESLHHNDIFLKSPSEFDKYTNKEILKYALGANLYMNGLKDFYNGIITGRFNDIVSISICFEDATKDSELEICEDNVLHMLDKLDKYLEKYKEIDFSVPLIFIRVRNYNQFISFTDRLSKNQMKHIAGFIFPKFNCSNGNLYLDYVLKLREKFNDVLYAMPIIETKEVIYKETRIEELINIKKIIDSYKDIILNVRVGGTDFSSNFGLRRSKEFVVYDIKVVCECLIDIVNMFSREGSEYVISAPVWEYFSEDHNSIEIKGLIKEIKADKENGFFGKTVIHPTQAKYVNAIYSVTYEEYIDAMEIINGADDNGVFKGYGGNKMNEVKPHLNWAKKILSRANVYGVLKDGIKVEDIYLYDLSQNNNDKKALLV